MSDVAKTIDRVEKLLRLSASPYPEEARTAAFKAAELIREHGLRVCANAPDQGLPKSSRAPGGKSVTIVSKFEGWCRVCQKSYAVGDRVSWIKGQGATHVECRRAAA